MGNSEYNGLEVTFNRTTGPLTFLASYTYSKSYDQTPNIQEQVDPYDYHRLDGISASDVKKHKMAAAPPLRIAGVSAIGGMTGVDIVVESQPPRLRRS
jgi:hypothetical protein